MRIAYIVSMFPCWSETFILNELINHQSAGVKLSIYSLKNLNEKMVHSDAIPFIPKTIYPYPLYDVRLWFFHFLLFITSPRIYALILFKLISLKAEVAEVKGKAMMTFISSPRYIMETKKRKIEHLHAHFATYPAVLAWIISSFLEIPFSVTAHAHDIYVNQDLLPIIYENSAAIVTISEFNKKFIIEQMGPTHANKINVIHCGIDLKRFVFDIDLSNLKERDRPVNILSIGRLSGIKGFSYLILALKLLKDEGVQFNCRIIGDGHLRNELINQVNELGLQKQVELMGSKKTEEIPEYLKNADVFILACARDKKEGHDGIPLVFMEAMAYGTPVIGTRLSGIPELIVHNETGLCAYPEDPNSLKSNIQYFIDNPTEIEKMTHNARSFVEEGFDIEENSQRLRELFSRIIKEKNCK